MMKIIMKLYYHINVLLKNDILKKYTKNVKIVFNTTKDY